MNVAAFPPASLPAQPVDKTPPRDELAAIRQLRDRMRAEILAAQQRLEGVELAIAILTGTPK